jgi:type I restriction enzyme R subunit
MLYSYGRFLLPHLPLDRDMVRVKLRDEVDLEYFRLQRIYSGEIALRDATAGGNEYLISCSRYRESPG